jgi:hypothetical protein
MFRVIGLSLRNISNSINSAVAAVPYARAVLFSQTESTTSIVDLRNLRDNPGARKKPVRAGRGIGSRIGKNCGHGAKGQKSRAGA